MSRNGSGVYSLPSGNPVVTGTTVQSTWANNTLSDIANALTGSLAADGQTPMTGNFPMGGNRITGMAAGTASTDAVTLVQAQSGALQYLTSVSGTNTVVGTVAGVLAYAEGQAFRFKPANNNAAGSTLNVNSLGAKSIKRNGTDLAAADLTAGQECTVIYDGTNFQLDWSNGTVAGRAFTTPSSVVFSATPTFDASVSNVFYLAALTANVTTFTINNPVDGQSINIRFVQDGTGSRTVALPATVKAAGSIDPTASRASWLVLIYVSSASRWEGAWSVVGA